MALPRMFINVDGDDDVEHGEDNLHVQCCFGCFSKEHGTREGPTRFHDIVHHILLSAMPDVIDLLSTPENSPRYNTSLNFTKSPNEEDYDEDPASPKLRQALHLAVEGSLKRRRLSPQTGTRLGLKSTTVTQSHGFTALWSSDDESSIAEQVVLPASASLQIATEWDEISQDGETRSLLRSKESPKRTGSRAPFVFEISSEDGQGVVHEAENICASQSMTTRAPYSQRTASILADLDENVRQTSAPVQKKWQRPGKMHSTTFAESSKHRSRIKRAASTVGDEILVSSSQPILEKTEKNRDKAAKKAKRDLEKEEERTMKRLDREQKAREKQKLADIAEANKSKTDRKVSTPEMILLMSTTLKDTSIGTQVEEYMKNLGVETLYLDSTTAQTRPAQVTLQVGNLIRWRRKVTAKMNEEIGQWEPLEKARVEEEKHVLIHLTAVEFASIATGQTTSTIDFEKNDLTDAAVKVNMDTYIKSIRDAFPDCMLACLIEGLSAWLKKSANAKNRAYTAAVRAQMVEDDNDQAQEIENRPTKKKPKKGKNSASANESLSFITNDIAESLLLHLQLSHQPFLIHHTSSASKTASQISLMTQQLSTRPYRVAQFEQNLKSASFCMDSGQVRTGDTAQDTFIKMLQEVQRVTPSMAYGIVEQWSSVGELVRGFRREGNLMLEDVKKSANKDGASSDRRLGPMVSKRLYKVFMGRDPATMDGMS